MTIKKIIVEGDPILRERAKEVPPASFGTPELDRLVDDLIETMRSAGGVGIAAPQIGVGLRVFIADSADGPVALADPVIVGHSAKTTTEEEGCLSVPGRFGQVPRYRSVDVEARAIDGTKLKFTADGYFARVLQHEYDHLEGILIIDRLKKEKKK